MQFSRIHVVAFLGVAALAWWAVLAIQGTAVTFKHLAPFGTVIGVLGGSVQLLEHVLWRQRWLHGWFVFCPDLRGTWRVKLQSDWTKPDGQRIPEIVCYMGVTQSLSRLQMHLMTPESESWFIANAIRASPNGNGHQVVGVYTNKPHIHLRGDRSEMHRGAIILDTHGPSWRPGTLSGEYWTDRKTAGTIVFSERRGDVLTRFEDANRIFSDEQKPV